MPVLAIAGTVLSTLAPSVVQGAPLTGGSMIRTLILPLVMSVIAVTAHVVATTIRRHRVRLVQNEQDLARTLAESVRRQALLDAVLKAVGVGVWVVDTRGHTVLANRAMRTDPALGGVMDPAGGPGMLMLALKQLLAEAGM